MRFKSLSELKRPELQEITFVTLPQNITMAHYARSKAFKINELVCTIFEDSFEWYGFTLSNREIPELIIDIGLPKNDQNLYDYTTIGSESIADFQESLPADTMINGWIHSHGALQVKNFSNTDEKNNLTVLDFVSARNKKVVAKKEIVIEDIKFLVQDQFSEKDLKKGSVSIITDRPIKEASIMETIYGSFCYSIVIGDDGWHKQEIIYKERGLLSGYSMTSSQRAEIIFVDTGSKLTSSDIHSLRDEVAEKIKPHTDPPPEMIERM